MMDLVILTLEDLQNAYPAFMAIASLRSATYVGVSATSQILKHHLAAAGAINLDAVSDGVNCCAAAILHLISIQAVSERIGALTTARDYLIDNWTDQLVIRHSLQLPKGMTIGSDHSQVLRLLIIWLLAVYGAEDGPVCLWTVIGDEGFLNGLRSIRHSLASLAHLVAGSIRLPTRRLKAARSL